MYTFFILFITDYALTYIGITSGYIIEGNPFMKYFMTLDFLPGFLIRIAFASLFCICFSYIKNKDPKMYVKMIRFVTSVFFMVMILHISWICRI